MLDVTGGKTKPQTKKKRSAKKKEPLPPQPKAAEKPTKQIRRPIPQGETKVKQKKVVLFRLSDEYYGIDVSKIDEIIDAHVNEKIAGMPDFVAGVISLRGEAIPVLSLNDYFHLGESTKAETNTVLITSKNGEVYGICIDELRGVIDIDTSSILAVPSVFTEEEMAYLEGIIKYGVEIAALIDIELIMRNYRLG